MFKTGKTLLTTVDNWRSFGVLFFTSSTPTITSHFWSYLLKSLLLRKENAHIDGITELENDTVSLTTLTALNFHIIVATSVYVGIKTKNKINSLIFKMFYKGNISHLFLTISVYTTDDSKTIKGIRSNNIK